MILEIPVQQMRGSNAALETVDPVPLEAQFVYNKTDKTLRIGDGVTPWSGLADICRCGGADGGIVISSHVLTEDEAKAKMFNVLGEMSGVFLSLGGVVQTPGADYELSRVEGYSVIGWEGLGLDAVEVKAGDVFVVIGVRSMRGSGGVVRHVLTEAEAEAKMFSVISSADNALLSFGGVVQTPGDDYEVVFGGGEVLVGWRGKGLDEIGVNAGDVFVLLLV